MNSGRHVLRKIAEIEGVPLSVVYDIKKHTTPYSKPRSGRPKVLTKWDLRRIDRYIKKSQQTRQATLAKIIEDLDLKVCPQTLVKGIEELGYSRKAA